MQSVIDFCIGFLKEVNDTDYNSALKKYFCFPERVDLLHYVVTKLENIVYQDETDEVVVATLKLLQRAVKVTKNVFVFNGTSEELITLFKEDGFESNTTSVAFNEDGVLAFNEANTLNTYYSSDEFWIDKFTCMTAIIDVINMMLKTVKDKTDRDFLLQRRALLRAINGAIDSMKTKSAKVFVLKHTTRPRVSIEQKDNFSIITVS